MTRKHIFSLSIKYFYQIKKVWIKNIVRFRKTRLLGIFLFFGEKSSPNVFHQKSAKKVDIFKIVFLRVAERFLIQIFFVGLTNISTCRKHDFSTGGRFFWFRRKLFHLVIFQLALWKLPTSTFYHNFLTMVFKTSSGPDY